MNEMEVYTTCPYNKCHRIRKSRYQIHITKCAKNYPKNYKVICKYNRTHLLDPQEYEHHLLVCPTSGNAKIRETTLEPNRSVGTIPIESICSMKINTMIEEDWSGNNQSYDPLIATEGKNIIRGAIAMSKSKKKQFRMYERERISLLESASRNASNNTSTTRKEVDIEQPLQAPKQLSKAMLCDRNFASNLISKLGKLKIEESNEKLETWSNSPKIEKNNSFSQEEKNCDSKMNVVSQGNSSETQGNNKKDNIQINNSQPKLSEQSNSNSQNIIYNTKVTARLYGEAKKISTGRGFTRIYQYLNSSMKNKEEEEEEEKEKSKDLISNYGYDKE